MAMDPKVMIDSIAELDGVYGTFFSSMNNTVITAKVPHDHSSKYLQSIAERCLAVHRRMQRAMPKCFELRIDMGHITVLMLTLEDGAMFVLIHNPKTVEFLRTAVYAICKTAIQTQQKNLALTQKISLVAPPKLPGHTPPVVEKEKTEGSEFVAINPDLPSQKLAQAARYTDEELIGEGGTAFVYRAFDTRIKRTIALKRFKEEQLSEAKDDYLSELETASRIQHHNVVSIFDADIDPRGRYIVMEFIEGIDLEVAIQQELLNHTRFIEVAIQSLEGLAATHRGGLLHLDLKPANIMIQREISGRDHVKLIDYGRARLTIPDDDDGRVARGAGLDGSIHFASPEYLGEQPLDERADLYSLGCVFYWCLTGQRPFEGETSLQILAAHMQGHVTPIQEIRPELPECICHWIMSLIQTKPDDRPANAAAALKSLMNSPSAVQQDEFEEKQKARA